MSESETEKWADLCSQLGLDPWEASAEMVVAEIQRLRKALERLRTRCHASTSGGGLQPFNVKAALAEIVAALASAERQDKA